MGCDSDQVLLTVRNRFPADTKPLATDAPKSETHIIAHGTKLDVPAGGDGSVCVAGTDLVTLEKQTLSDGKATGAVSVMQVYMGGVDQTVTVPMQNAPNTAVKDTEIVCPAVWPTWTGVGLMAVGAGALAFLHMRQTRATAQAAEDKCKAAMGGATCDSLERSTILTMYGDGSKSKKHCMAMGLSLLVVGVLALYLAARFLPGLTSCQECIARGAGWGSAPPEGWKKFLCRMFGRCACVNPTEMTLCAKSKGKWDGDAAAKGQTGTCLDAMGNPMRCSAGVCTAETPEQTPEA